MARFFAGSAVFLSPLIPFESTKQSARLFGPGPVDLHFPAHEMFIGGPLAYLRIDAI
jgi:hypothetical protein